MSIICEQEKARLKQMSLHENRLREKGFFKIAGVDEAGRGPLAGPVVAAAVILPKDFILESLNDSKQLTIQARERLYQDLLREKELIYGVGIVDVDVIDQVNILQASFLAMQKAVSFLKSAPDYLLIDGNRSFKTNIPCEPIVDGDALSVSIAAASIFAKVTRDNIMKALAIKYPQYGFDRHKGYATEKHLKAIEEHGPSPIHRKSFSPIKQLRFPNL